MALQQKPDAGTPPCGAAYEYRPVGTPKKRTWARGVSAPYTHNHLVELSGTDYSDPMPDVPVLRDACRRTVSVRDKTDRTDQYEVEARARGLPAHGFRKRRSRRNLPKIGCRWRFEAKDCIVLLGPFGEPLRATGALAKANPFRFSTHYTDEETGLLYAKRRYFSTATAKWLSPDPKGERGGVNLLNYVGNSPISYIDPFGLTLFTEGNVAPLVKMGAGLIYSCYCGWLDGSHLQFGSDWGQMAKRELLKDLNSGAQSYSIPVGPYTAGGLVPSIGHSNVTVTSNGMFPKSPSESILRACPERAGVIPLRGVLA